MGRARTFFFLVREPRRKLFFEPLRLILERLAILIFPLGVVFVGFFGDPWIVSLLHCDNKREQCFEGKTPHRIAPMEGFVGGRSHIFVRRFEGSGPLNPGS